MYEKYFGDESVNKEEFFKQRQYKEIHLNPWGEDNKKTDDYIIPLNAPIGPKEAKNIEEMTLEWRHEDKAFIVDSIAQTPDVPYGNTFQVATRYCVTSCGTHSCRVRLTADIKWIKKPFTAGMITTKTKEGIG